LDQRVSWLTDRDNPQDPEESCEGRFNLDKGKSNSELLRLPRVEIEKPLGSFLFLGDVYTCARNLTKLDEGGNEIPVVDT
jgi:hypothetical protein